MNVISFLSDIVFPFPNSNDLNSRVHEVGINLIARISILKIPERKFKSNTAKNITCEGNYD